MPGLSLALATPALMLTLDVELRSGQRLTFDVPVPPPVPALVIKAAAYRSRLFDTDAVDIWRLLEVAARAEVSPDDLEGTGSRADARKVLNQYFGRRNAPGTVAAAGSDQLRTRIAFLVLTHVGRPAAQGR